jgi:hypothetical protein
LTSIASISALSASFFAMDPWATGCPVRAVLELHSRNIPSSVDRLGRSLMDLLGLLKELHAKGVDLFLHQQGLDTSTPSGRAMFQMLGVFAEFERAMILERVMAGIARARADGTKLGRRSVEETHPEKIKAARALRAKGCGLRKSSTHVEYHDSDQLELCARNCSSASDEDAGALKRFKLSGHSLPASANASLS